MTQAVTLTGQLTRDAELTFTAGGRPLAKFSIACERKWGTDDETGGEKKQTSFFDVVCWGRLAENVAQCCVKGVRVVVEGRIEQRSFETQQGEKRSKVEVTANEVGLSLLWETGEIHKRNRSTPDDPRSNHADPDYSSEEY